MFGSDAHFNAFVALHPQFHIAVWEPIASKPLPDGELSTPPEAPADFPHRYNIWFPRHYYGTHVTRPTLHLRWV